MGARTWCLLIEEEASSLCVWFVPLVALRWLMQFLGDSVLWLN